MNVYVHRKVYICICLCVYIIYSHAESDSMIASRLYWCIYRSSELRFSVFASIIVLGFVLLCVLVAILLLLE